MWQIDRDRVWFFAWGCIPVALLLNLIFGFSHERASLLTQQASVDAISEEWSQSAERFERAAEFDPKSARLAYNAAASLTQSGDYPRALRWNEEALRRDPKLEEALRARPILEKLAAGAAPGRDATPADGR